MCLKQIRNLFLLILALFFVSCTFDLQNDDSINFNNGRCVNNMENQHKFLFDVKKEVKQTANLIAIKSQAIKNRVTEIANNVTTFIKNTDPNSIDISDMDNYHEYYPDPYANPAMYVLNQDYGWGTVVITGAVPITDESKRKLKLYETFEITTQSLKNAYETLDYVSYTSILDRQHILGLAYPFMEYRGFLPPGLDPSVLYDFGYLRFDWWKQVEIEGKPIWFPIFIDMSGMFSKACHAPVYNADNTFIAIVCIHFDLYSMTQNTINNSPHMLMILSDDVKTNNYLLVGINEAAQNVTGLHGYKPLDWAPGGEIAYVEQTLNLEYADKPADIKLLAQKLREKKNDFVHTIFGQRFHVISETIPSIGFKVVGLIPIPAGR